MSSPVRFGRYLLERRLAMGGMAEVFLGRIEGPEGFEKKVVVKRILPHLQSDSNHVEMFLDEARLAARFNHPNLIQVYELARIEDQYCLAMEYIEGEDVAAILDESLRLKRKTPFGVVAYIIANAAQGLHYAHELATDDGEPLNVVHRDISPANIIVTRSGGVKIVDFGIAKHEIATSQTVAGTLKGKFSYMSPEQARGEQVDRRSDIFSLGTILYELLTVSPCFTGGNQIEILENVTQVRYRKLKSLRPDMPPRLQEILERMLTGEREDRYANASDVFVDLQSYLAEIGIPSANDIGNFLSQLFGRPSTRQPNRVATAITDFDEVPVTDEFSSPAVMADEDSYRLLVDSQSMSLNDLNLMMEERTGGRRKLETSPFDSTSDGYSDAGFDELSEPSGFDVANVEPSDTGLEPFDIPTGMAKRGSLGGRRRSTLSQIADRLSEPRYWPTTLAIIAVTLTLGASALVMVYRASVGLPWKPSEILSTLLDEQPADARPSDESETGSLQVMSDPPGAQVKVDGSLQEGRTPLTVDNLAVDIQHSVSVSMDGYKTITKMIDVRADLLTSLPLKLAMAVATDQRGLIEVSSDPAGATILINGEPGDDVTPATLSLPVGEEVELSAKLAGYVATAQRTTPVAADAAIEVEIPLAREAAAAGSGKGVLDIDSSPDTDVYIGGRKVGSTPMRRLELAAGPVVVQLRHRSLGLSKTLKLTIPVDDVLKKRVVFRKGQVLFDVRPWADVYLGRKKLGTTPMPPVSLYEGSYAIRLVNPEMGVEKTVQITVRAGKPRRVVEKLR